MTLFVHHESEITVIRFDSSPFRPLEMIDVGGGSLEQWRAEPITRTQVPLTASCKPPVHLGFASGGASVPQYFLCSASLQSAQARHLRPLTAVGCAAPPVLYIICLNSCLSNAGEEDNSALPRRRSCPPVARPQEVPQLLRTVFFDTTDSRIS